MSQPSHALFLASQYASQGRLTDMLSMLVKAIEADGAATNLIAAANLCIEYGCVSAARQYYERVLALEADSLPAWAGLAKVATDVGDHGLASTIYERLVQQHPDSDTLRRNALVAAQYNPQVTDQERLAQAIAWGQWAVTRAGGPRPRPRPRILALNDRAPRIGVVSADLCQHTVGLFVKDVLAELGQRWHVVAYHARGLEDWVSKTIKSTCQWRAVAGLDDQALASLIGQDEIDILIDLSGHTAGSRLTAFAHRPAPVMVSWLGYFASTGLPYMDAVLLDHWHAQAGTQTQFVEPIEYISSGRFYYRPVPWSPKAVSQPPCVEKGHVTFGCFNNTAKLNPSVLQLWSRVLKAVPQSRLILKWRTLNDENFGGSVRHEFAKHGIDPDRIELRGAGFHVDVLNEYADIDIALDPFPFTGGLTSCEALWMGVPVLTWPQASVVSRQTLAFVSAIELPQLAASDADAYVQMASDLASDPQRLRALRMDMRARMQSAGLMNLSMAVTSLQQALLSVHARVLSQAG